MNILYLSIVMPLVISSMTNSISVTKLIVQSDGVAVYFDVEGIECMCLLTTDIVVHYQITTSMRLSHDQYIKICKVSSMLCQFTKMQKRLVHKRLSAYEVEYSFMMQCQDIETVDEMIGILKKQELINDTAYVAALCNDAIIKRKGFQYCLQVAKNKKIDTQLLVPLYDQFMLEQQAVLSHRIDKLVQLETSKQDIITKLVYHGFAKEDILSTLDDKEIDFEISKTQFDKLNQKYRKHNNFERKQKMVNYFLLKGYNRSVIENTFQKYWEEKENEIN